MARVVIVGGGISGLAAAYRLEQFLPDAEVLVLEQRARPGGTVWTVEAEGFRFEAGPNGFLDTNPSTLELCRELGLADRLVEASEASGKNRYLLFGGKLQALPSGPLSFLRSPLLSWRGKVSLLLERFRSKRTDDRDESIDAFARRRAGAEAADVFADALVTGIHAGDPKLLSVNAAFPRLAALEQEFGSVIKGLGASARRRRAEAAARGEAPRRGKLWSFREGLALLTDSLAARLRRPPLLGVDVRRIWRGESWSVEAGAETWHANAVVLACPAHEQAALVADLDPELADVIAAIPYNRIAVIALGYRAADVPRPLDGFGYIAPQRLRGDVLGVQWCSSIFPERAPPGSVLLRAMCGGWHRADVAGWDEPRLLGAVREDLRRALGITAAPCFHRVVRWERAIPQYHLGHLQRVAHAEALAARHPGLFLAGNAYRGVALNDCTERAATIALGVRDYLAARGQSTAAFFPDSPCT